MALSHLPSLQARFLHGSLISLWFLYFSLSILLSLLSLLTGTILHSVPGCHYTVFERGREKEVVTSTSLLWVHLGNSGLHRAATQTDTRLRHLLAHDLLQKKPTAVSVEPRRSLWWETGGRQIKGGRRNTERGGGKRWKGRAKLGGMDEDGVCRVW